eukprot:1160299-Pelagomonas_calceolata.AAC.3
MGAEPVLPCRVTDMKNARGAAPPLHPPAPVRAPVGKWRRSPVHAVERCARGGSSAQSNAGSLGVVALLLPCLTARNTMSPTPVAKSIPACKLRSPPLHARSIARQQTTITLYRCNNNVK